MAAEDLSDELILKLGAGVASLAAGWLTQRLVGVVWKSVTGSAAPRKTNDADLHIAQAVAFAAISAGVAVLVNRAVNHGVQHVAHSFIETRHEA
jgi:hypothetical protein